MILINTVLYPIKVISNKIEKVMHPSCYCVLDLLCVNENNNDNDGGMWFFGGEEEAEAGVGGKVRRVDEFWNWSGRWG